MKEIVFVILHYNAIADTIECINSIEKTNVGVNYSVVVVDNNSPNKSGIELYHKYKDSQRVVVILNDKNEGFARGNNIGFVYAKKTYNPNFIVLLNNDTIILQNNFFSLVKEEYDLNKFAVLGPVIETPNKINNLNPGRIKMPSIPYYLWYTFKVLILYIFSLCNLDVFYKNCKSLLTRTTNVGDGTYCKDSKSDVMLHGCFLVFSRVYICTFNGLNDRTFLFGEEDLLYLRLKTNKLMSYYSPKIRIYHKEDVSTGTIRLKGRYFRQFMYKQYIHSSCIIISELLKLKFNRLK